MPRRGEGEGDEDEDEEDDYDDSGPARDERTSRRP
jgi:hypothetical protein